MLTRAFRIALPSVQTGQVPWRGNSRRGPCLMFLLFIVLAQLVTLKTAAPAEITVEPDRDPIGVDESFELTFTASGSVDADPDFTILEKDFDLLGQSQRSNISVINGQYSKTTSWVVQLMPKREGMLTIPSIAFGHDSSPPLQITVTPATVGQRDAVDKPDLFLEVEAEPANPYVQQQVIVTVRVLNRVEIAQATLSEPTLTDAIVEKLGEDKRYQSQRNGLRYTVIERAYAVFPQRSGETVIPAMELNAQVVGRRRPRSMFDDFLSRRPTRTRRVRSEPVPLKVRPIPATFTGRHWLPAQRVTLERHWSTTPPTVTTGEPITLTLTLQAEGVPVSELPEIGLAGQIIRSTSNGELKQYPDQPVLDEHKTAHGLVSRREEKSALIPSDPGDYDLPPVSVEWWNTRTDRMEIARLPAQTIEALPPAQPHAASTGPARSAPAMPTTDSRPGTETRTAAAVTAAPTLWQWTAVLCALGWALTAAAWWWRHARTKPSAHNKSDDSSERTAARAIKVACAHNQTAEAKTALLKWARAHWKEDAPGSLTAIARRCGGELREEIERLDRALYGQQSGDWRGLGLWQAFAGHRKETRTRRGQQRPNGSALEPLYKS